MRVFIKTVTPTFFFAVIVIFGVTIVDAAGASPCIPQADQVNFSGVQKRLLPLPNECPVTGKEGKFCGRGEHSIGEYAPSPQCAVPTMIVMHTTHGSLTRDEIFEYFNRGSDGRGVGSHFGIGKDGGIVQMVEMGKNRVEYAQTVGNIDDHISIEMGAPGNYASIAQQPAGQYQSALKLVKALMKQYNIAPNRVISHASLGGRDGDPGEGWMTEFRNALRGTTDVDGLPITGGDSTDTDSTAPGTAPVGIGQTSATSECVNTKVGETDQPTPTPLADCKQGSSQPGTAPGVPGGGGQPGQPLPSQNPDEIMRVLCSQYKVCPTETDAWKSKNGWTLMQLSALWNIVQKIYESPTYRNYAIGNHVLELTRAGHYTSDPQYSWVWGFHANASFSEYHEIPNSRLIIITDTTNEAGSQKTLEWFFAHEIGHAASYGRNNGEWRPNINLYDSSQQNPGYRAVQACGETVSKYGNGSRDENYADTVSYYLTTGEEVTAYWGKIAWQKGASNLKVDHPCSYNALKSNYFDGKEF